MKKNLLLILLIILISLFKASSVQAQTSCPTVPTNTGTVTFSTTTTAGTYRVWSRMKAADSINNSFYLKIDNNCAILVGNSSQISSSTWTWVDYQNGNTSTKINATLTAGAHVITLIGNEPGVSVDKVLLTKNLSCVPIGFGTNCPAELPTSSPAPSPTLNPTSTSTPTPTPTSTPTPVPGSFSQYIEAENFTLSSPMTKGSDTRAWNGQYISPTTGVDSETPVREAYASISLSTSGNYYLWARMMGPTNASDALYLGFDNSWDRKVPSAIGAYEWVRVRNYASSLTAGPHIIQVGHGEINARLDTVFVTNDANAVPIQSTPTPTPTSTPGPTSSCPTVPTNTGTVTFSTTTTAGTYRVWSRMKAADSINNSFYLKIDNNCAILVGNSSQISSSTWTWVDYQNGNTSTKINATLTAGAHVITLIGNEPGVSVDKVLLTKNLSCVPIGFGTNCPAELPTSSPAPSPTLNPTSTSTPTPTNTPTVCTADAKLCPDGSYVPRIPPTCQFAQCPYTTPTPTVAPTLTPTPVPAVDATLMSLNLKLHGIGKGGDNANPTSLGNQNPIHTQKTISVSMFNSSNQLISNKSGTIVYQSSPGVFTGTIDMGNNLSSGVYSITLKTEKYLTRLIPIQNIISGQNNSLPQAVLVVGDINGDNKLSILDYNILIGCYSEESLAISCSASQKQLSDLDDNGSVNQFDYNLFLRNFSAQSGDSI